MHKSVSIRRNIKTSLVLLKILDLCLDGEEGFFETKFYWMCSICANFLTEGSFIVGLFLYIFANFHNFDLVAGNAYLALIFSIPLVKFVFFLKGWSRVKDLVKQLNKEEFQPTNKKEEIIVLSNFRAYRTTNIIYAASFVFLLPLWILSSLFVHSEEPKLPFMSWYPFDLSSARYFAVAYLHQTIGVFYCALAEWSMDLVIFGLIACLAAECDLLSYRLRSICVGYTMGKDLVHQITHHWKILKFTEDANDFLGTLSFVQFALSNLTNCMTMFELSVLPPLNIHFFNVFQVQLCLLSELLIYCYFGNNILSKSVEISDALCAMLWIDGCRNFKRNTLFFVMKTQGPMKISVNLFLLSLPTFTSIVRSFYSFTAMLHQTQLKKAG